MRPNHYRRPEYLGVCISSNMDPAVLARLRENCKIVNEANQETYRSLKAKHTAMLAYATELYGAGSNEERYIQQRPVDPPPPYHFSEFERRIMNLRADEERLRRQQEAERERTELLEKAVPWLLERGKKIGENFTLATAVELANTIAYEEAVRAAESNAAKVGYVGFDGMNCDGPCSGWDGKSHRCDCGNRRVYWETGWGHTFLNPYVRATAY